MSTDAYLDAKHAFEAADSEVMALSHLILEAGGALNSKPGKLIFANVSIGLPIEASMRRDSVSIDGNRWKDAAQIQEMLANWHKLKDAMETAWRAIPEQRSQGLKPPGSR